MSSIAAVVTHAPEDGQMKMQYEQITPPRQPRERELLVRMVSAGICHTDIFASHIPTGAMGISHPKVLGHEGAGYVEAIGSGVTVAAVGDPVLLSYTFCKTCDLCTNDAQSYCEKFGLLNVVGDSESFGTPEQPGPAGKFFGQSSFAAMSVVDEQCVVNVKDSLQNLEELKKCAPLGCGLMTGAGTSFKHLTPRDILVVAGLGAVGMGAIMAAKKVGTKAIIAVDRVESRIALAKELGATHGYSTADRDLEHFVADVQGLVDGQRISYAIDTTGFVPLIEKLVPTLGKRGKLLQIGVPAPGVKVTLPMDDFFNQTKSFEVNFLGDAKAAEFIPRMIQWYRDGTFPFDKLIRFYDVKDVGKALQDMQKEVIKPIITF